MCPRLVRSVAICTGWDQVGRARSLRGSRYAYMYTSTSTYIHVCIHLSLHIYTCIHICISHMYINIHKHMYITRVYLHTYTYVYHTPKTPTTRIRVAQPSAAPLLRSFECRAAFSRRRGMYRHSQEDMHWLSLVWKGVLGAEEAGVGVKTVVTAARGQRRL